MAMHSGAGAVAGAPLRPEELALVSPEEWPELRFAPAPGTAVVVERADLGDEESLRLLAEACALARDARVLVVLVTDTSSTTPSARIAADAASFEVLPAAVRPDDAPDSARARAVAA